MIREASLRDMPHLVRMARRFHSLTDYADVVPLEMQSFCDAIERFLKTDEAVVLVAAEGDEVFGMAAAIAYPHWWNHGHRTAQELFWWVDEAHRGGTAAIRLLNSLETWARSVGCSTFSMIHTPNLSPGSLKSLYTRRGYRQWDHFYTKEL